MAAPLYKNLHHPRHLPDTGHRGVWFDRFFDRFSQTDWSLEAARDGEEGPKADPKQAWLRTVTQSPCGHAGELADQARRLETLGKTLNGQSRAFRTEWHFATGLGLPHPAENGFSWHPTLGVPYLCGAAVKGLVRTWMMQWDDSALTDPKREENLLRLFGDMETAGGLIFFDALPVSPPSLSVDVMTPHMGQWYLQGEDREKLTREWDKTVPADWHDPVPVPFLVVKEAVFLFTIAPRTSEMNKEVEPALNALRQALDWLGAGAKTAAGYGRMTPDDEALSELQRTAIPSHPWLETAIPELMKKHHINPGQEEEIWRGKALAKKWQDIDDPLKKEAVLKIIQARGKAMGWWDPPHGRATRQAKTIYNGE